MQVQLFEGIVERLCSLSIHRGYNEAALVAGWEAAIKKTKYHHLILCLIISPARPFYCGTNPGFCSSLLPKSFGKLYPHPAGFL
jgi:hypothetical protein